MEELLYSKKPVFLAISGVKNSGKTTLITRLLPILIEKGLRVAVIKHDGHDFEADISDTDTYKQKQAGAYGTGIFNQNKLMLVKDNCWHQDETHLATFFPEADLILLEGFKNSAYPKIEIVRAGNSQEPVCNLATVLAIVTDCKLAQENIPLLSFNQIQPLAAIIVAYWHSAKNSQ